MRSVLSTESDNGCVRCGYSLTVANANEHAGKKACPYAQSGATALTGLN